MSGVILHFFSIFDKQANMVDPDQTPRFAASDLGLQCLPRSLKMDAKLIWVKKRLFPFSLKNILPLFQMYPKLLLCLVCRLCFS